MCRLILSILVVLISIIVLVLAIYQCFALSRLDPSNDGFVFQMIFGILLLLLFFFTAINGLWGAVTGNYRMVASFASCWVCTFILVVILIAVYAAAASNCSDAEFRNIISCSEDPWAEVLPRLIFVLVFSVIAAIIGYALASNLRNKAFQNDSCC